MKELNFNDIKQVSGGGRNGADHEPNWRGASTNYGGQANGFQANYAAGAAGANMYHDLSSNCGLAMLGGTAGLVGAGVTRSITGVISSVTGMVAGCRADSQSASRNGPPFH